MNKVQILVIEDDVAVGNLITTTLEMENYQFRLAKTAKQGIMNVLSYNPSRLRLTGYGWFGSYKEGSFLVKYSNYCGFGKK